MSIKYEKYTDKSFVVRGTYFDKTEQRKDVSKKFQGNCIWNTRLKGGAGLLVPINENNQGVIDRLIKDHSGDESPDVSKKEKEQPKKEDLSPPPVKKDDQSKKEKKYHSDSDNSDDEKRLAELLKKKYSDSDNSDSENDNRRRRPVSSRDSREYGSSYKKEPRKSSKYNSSSDEDSDSDDSRRKSRKSSRNSRDSRGKHSSSPSSDESGDSSEDERIQYSIRRREKYSDESEKQELDTSIDSDVEDVVSLSRRLRFVTRKLKELESKK